MPRYYTVGEANRTLPLVKGIVADIVSTHRELEKRAEAYRSVEAETSAGQARHDALNAEIQELTWSVNRFIGELHELGVLFKGFGEGLVDFFSTLNGRPVFLCWKLGEERVEWWHELEAGFVGRQEIPRELLGQDTGGEGE